jgi:hypothetical protein
MSDRDAIRVHLTNGPNPIRDFESSFVDAFGDEVRRASAAYRVTEDPDSADLIVLLESVNQKTLADRDRLERCDLVRRHEQKCVTLNYEDDPPGFLPGLYMSLPAHRFDPDLHRSWACVFGDGYEEILRIAGELGDVEPKLLFSFRGAPSHAVRRTLFSRDFDSRHPFRISNMDRWLDYSSDEQTSYVQEILDSRFVLCPRGIGCGTHRLFEVMSLGRCPVVISDAWVATGNVPWERFVVRIAETEIDDLVATLERRAPDAAALGAEARRVWEALFSPERRAIASLDQLCEIQAARTTGAAVSARWRERRFLRSNGWLLSQRIRRGVGSRLRR